MTPSVQNTAIIIFTCALCTFLERALPFLVFRNRAVPGAIRYLGKVLPMAVIALLIIYNVRTISFHAVAGFAPEAIGIAVVTLLHLWKRNMFLSIFGGTVCYMLLVQVVFVV